MGPKMKKVLHHILILIIFSFCFLSNARADVTTQHVWNKLRFFITAAGFELTATEIQKNNELKIKDLIFSKSITPKNYDQDVQISLLFSSLLFRQNDSGTVTILLPKQVQIKVQSKSPATQNLNLAISYNQNKTAIQVSGTPKELFYKYKAKIGRLELEGLTVNGINFSQFDLFAHVDLEEISIDSSTTKSTTYNFINALNFDKVSYSTGMNTANSTLNLTGEISNFLIANNLRIPFSKNVENSADFLAAGTSLDTSWQYDSRILSFVSKEVDKDGSYKRESTRGSGSLKLNHKTIKLFFESMGTDLLLSHDDLPFSVEIQLKTIATKILLPLFSDSNVDPFSLKFELTDVVMSEILWALFDENGVLPRTPISLLLNLNGKTKFSFSDLKSAIWATQTASKQFPVGVEELTLQEFHLSGADAAVSSSGNFEFDNSDFHTFEGLPRPTGQLEVKAQGIDTLLDRLNQIGLIPQAQALGIQMMLPLFTTSGSVDDELKMLLEVTKSGQILTNGQRIR